MSDWHNEPGDIVLPTTLLEALQIDPADMARYRFLDTVTATKQRIRDFYLEHCSISAPLDNMLICQNGTALITLLLRALKTNGVNRVLVVTPAYFSVFDNIETNGQHLIYVHADITASPSITGQIIIEMARAQMVDAIFITNPIFASGEQLTAELIDFVIDYSCRAGVWVIVDESLAGLPWSGATLGPYTTPVMKTVAGSPRAVYIWSITKSLFINGLKHSLAIAPSTIVRGMEKAADLMVGGFTAHQLALIEKIYDTKNMQQVINCADANIHQFMHTYDLCCVALQETPLRITAANSGFHSAVFIPNHHENSTSRARELVTLMIEAHGISSIPLAHFGYPISSPIGVRINLSKDPKKLYKALIALAKIVDENFNLTN